MVGFVREFVDFTGDNGDQALPFTLEDEDVRLERGEWVYYVRAVRKGKSLRADFSPIDLTGLALYLLLGGFVDEWRSRRPWKVGVIRRRNRGLWRLRILHQEVLPAGQGPQPRVEELARRVELGEFDPVVRPRA